MNELEASLARLKGAIMAKDKGLALVELNAAYEHWKSLGRVKTHFNYVCKKYRKRGILINVVF